MTAKYNFAPDWILRRQGNAVKDIVLSMNETGIWMVDYIKVLYQCLKKKAQIS